MSYPHRNHNTKQEIFTSSNSSITLNTQVALVKHVYANVNSALLGSLLCFFIVFIAVFKFGGNNKLLYQWSSLFLIISAMRFYIGSFLHKGKQLFRHVNLWRNIYIVTASASGMAWGLCGFMLYPNLGVDQQALVFLLVAGVTAAAVPMASAVPEGSILFILWALMPFVIVISRISNFLNELFALALMLYLIYLTVLVFTTYRLLRDSIVTRFLNINLLENLSAAKEELEIINQKLEDAATHDPLTHVANRSLFEFNLAKALKHAKENKKILGLFYIDLDYFKNVNDLYGHHVGDKVLVLIIERLKNFFHTEDIISRLGGDEITVILENVSDVNELKNIAERLCELISAPIKMGNSELTLSASIGISAYPQDGSDVESLLQLADQSMYFVKQRGGNSYYAHKI